MFLALRTGQPFSDLLRWHPRDADTARRLLLDDVEREEQERQQRERAAQLAAARQAVHDQMRGGR